MKLKDGIIPGRSAVAGLLLLVGCTARPPVPPEALEPLPPPPDSLELDAAPSPAAEPDAAPAMRATGRTGPGILPGVTDRETPTTLEDSLFERRLQERQKRVNLGLDRPEREQEPVDNLIDFDF